MDSIMSGIESTSALALRDVTNYFAERDVNAETKRVDRALKMLGLLSKMRATRANEASKLIMIAKMVGMRGQELAPVWESITGRPLPALLDSSEQTPKQEKQSAADKSRARR